MKRTSVLCLLVLCSMLLCLSIGTIKAAEPGYSFTEYYSGAAVTIDGKVTGDEWRDVTTQYIPSTGAHLGLFEYKMDITDYSMTWLLEFADNTNDAGDRWQICVDGANDGGTAPKSDDVKVEIEGHTTVKIYVGTGTAWAAATATANFKDSLTTSQHDPANHYVCEVAFSKAQWTWGSNPPPHGVRVAMYDASKPAQGWIAWPPEAVSKDNPSRWGAMPDYTAAPAPEGLTIGVMMLVSIAAVVSIRYFRKPTKL